MAAVGCGADYAVGALYALAASNMTPKAKVIKALECAAFFSGSVTPPFVLITNK